MSETQAEINEVIARIERREFAHIALLVGSVVSAVGESACATVPVIRDRLVIDALLRRFALPGATVETEVISLLTKLRRGSDHPLRQAVADLPFEQFMSCLHRVAPDQAHEIVGLACRTGSSFAANFNHRAVASLALSLRAADFDPAELERIEERLFALRAAARKYSTPVDRLAALAVQMAGDVALIDAGAEQLKKLEAAAREAGQRYAAAATKLSAARAKAAVKLDKAVNAELPPLKLERASFTTQLEADESAAGPQGIDRVEFWVQTNPGTRPGPLMKVASGGELSRFLLALKVVLADRGSAPTLVFDEIDTGVGGAVADAIGTRLARLAGKVQVMAVTHAPQVAARADQHLLISKDALDKGKRVATRVAALAADRRREEIARMLAGAEITDAARAAAESLMRVAGPR